MNEKMSFCAKHSQYYTDFCVYCGPPPYMTNFPAHHICESGGTTTGGTFCRICSKDLTPRYNPQIWCGTDLSDLSLKEN